MFYRIPSRATANAAGLPSLERKEYVTLAEIQMLQKQRQQQQLATGKAMEKVGSALDEENMGWSPQTNYHRSHYKAMDTPNLASV